MKKFYFSILAVAVLFFSCEENIDVDLDESLDPVLIVEGSITTDTTAHLVKLGWSGDYLDNSPLLNVTGAYVSISDGENIFTLAEIEEGLYATGDSVHGEYGKSYTLTIELQDGRIFTATDKINNLSEIDSITTLPIYTKADDPFIEFSGRRHVVNFNGQEIAGETNFYMWDLSVNGVLQSDTIWEKAFVDDQVVEGAYVDNFPIFEVPLDELPLDTILVNGEYMITDTSYFEVEMLSISEAYYDFLVGFMLETQWRGGPLDGPPADIPTNVSEGGTGFFNASGVKREGTRVITYVKL